MENLFPLNEEYVSLSLPEFRAECERLFNVWNPLRMMFASDEREPGEGFVIYAVFSIAGRDEFRILKTKPEEKDGMLSFESLTPLVPAAHWYEREIRDMLGIVPLGHPDPRPLVLHGVFPPDIFPLRRDVSEAAIKRGVDYERESRYEYMEVEGERVFEIPVGPVHAGIIEPGHFRFSAVGESIYYLDPRLFFTHKGVEKRFEGLGFRAGVALAERVSGVSSFSHSTAYALAVERMAGIQIPEKAMAVRTILLELERIYNHIGDIGNMCAGTGLAVGNQRGAVIKEKLLCLNQRLTGSRFLRGVNMIGGVSQDILKKADDLRMTLEEVTGDYKEFMAALMGATSHMERLENAGVLSLEVARKLGATGIAARASGVNDDMRTVHKHLHYDRVAFEPHSSQRGDVLARMMVRADEVECSLSIITSLLDAYYGAGGREAPLLTEFDESKMKPGSCALGYTEGPRGSIFYFVKAAQDGMPLRVKVRSASFCNWPLMPFAVRGNIVPDFPLINKSFNLSYSGCDM
jgi:Ni,Fe-hydrogenase III large subunit/Ni,Fe-hydrogenase III component G